MSKPSLIPHVYKLWLLQQVAETGSFQAAAREAGITQSALSQNLTTLERLLGKTLLVRGRGVTRLSEDGRLLMARTAPLLDGLDQLSDGLDSSTPTPDMKVTLGAYESIAISVLPGLIPALRRRHPRLRLTIQTARSSELHTRVRKGELDMALAIRGPALRGLKVIPFADDYLGVFVAAGETIGRLGAQSLQDIGIGTLAPGKDGHPPYYQRFVRKYITSNQIVLTTESFEILRNLAVSGVFAAVLPLQVGMRHPRVLKPLSQEFLDPERNPSRHQLCLLSRPHLEPSLAQILTEEIRSMFGD